MSNEKSFNEKFEKISAKHNYYYVFDHFLSFAINSLSFNYNKKIIKQINETYTEEERKIFTELIFDWFQIMNDNIKEKNRKWFDFLGEFYEKASLSNKKNFSQFFTPSYICDLMAKVLVDKEYNVINDPCCGSGRMQLSVHGENHELIHFANDIDPICVKMSALNFFIHGVKGIVTCGDTLDNEEEKYGFLINYGDFPNIYFLQDDFSCEHAQRKLNRAIMKFDNKSVNIGEQLKLFSF